MGQGIGLNVDDTDSFWGPMQVPFTDLEFEEGFKVFALSLLEQFGSRSIGEGTSRNHVQDSFEGECAGLRVYDLLLGS